jgi:hypothetical protein
VRERLRSLLATRLTVGLNLAEQHEYHELCQLEWELLEGTRRAYLDLRERTIDLDGPGVERRHDDRAQIAGRSRRR